MAYSLKDFLQITTPRHPTFSPDGTVVAFLSDVSGVAQLFSASTVGHQPPQPLTAFDEPIQFAAFSPKQCHIAFGMASGGNERAQIFLFDVHTQATRPLTQESGVIHHWGGWSPDGEWLTFSSNARNGVDFDVYILHVASGKTRRVFAQGGWCDSLGFSSAGRYVLVRQQHTFHSHNLFLVDLQKDDAADCITPHNGTAEYEEPCWLPDDEGVIFTSSTDREFTGIEFYDTASYASCTLHEPEWDVMKLSIHPDGHTLAFMLNEAGYSRVQLLDVRSQKIIRDDSLPNALVTEIVWSPSGEHLACVAEQTNEPPNVLLWSARAQASWSVTHNSTHIPQNVFVEPTLASYPSFDGRDIPIFVFTPHEVPEDRPAIVVLHGGPEAQFHAGFHPLVQYFVMRGYTVIAPNIRGSRGYGKTFLALDDLDKRMDSIRDLEYLHRYIAAEGLADPARVALMGGSYGGYMTLAGLAFQPKLWAAGVDRVGMSNLVTFLENTAPWRRKIREGEYGSLEYDRELLQSLSPMNVIDQVRAPLLVIHGANDPRIPLAEAEQIVRELKSRNRTAELIVYPDEGHGLGKFKNRLHAYERTSEFLDEHVRGHVTPVVPS